MALSAVVKPSSKFIFTLRPTENWNGWSSSTTTYHTTYYEALPLFLCFSLYAKHSVIICEDLKAGLDNGKLTLFWLVVGPLNLLSPSQSPVIWVRSRWDCGSKLLDKRLKWENRKCSNVSEFQWMSELDTKSANWRTIWKAERGKVLMAC